MLLALYNNESAALWTMQRVCLCVRDGQVALKCMDTLACRLSWPGARRRLHRQS